MSCRHWLIDIRHAPHLNCSWEWAKKLSVCRDCESKTYRLFVETLDTVDAQIGNRHEWSCIDLTIEQVRQLADQLANVAGEHEPWYEDEEVLP
jgi:hypothetical protein